MLKLIRRRVGSLLSAVSPKINFQIIIIDIRLMIDRNSNNNSTSVDNNNSIHRKGNDIKSAMLLAGMKRTKSGTALPSSGNSFTSNNNNNSSSNNDNNTGANGKTILKSWSLSVDDVTLTNTQSVPPGADLPHFNNDKVELGHSSMQMTSQRSPNIGAPLPHLTLVSSPGSSDNSHAATINNNHIPSLLYPQRISGSSGTGADMVYVDSATDSASHIAMELNGQNLPSPGLFSPAIKSSPSPQSSSVSSSISTMNSAHSSVPSTPVGGGKKSSSSVFKWPIMENIKKSLSKLHHHGSANSLTNATGAANVTAVVSVEDAIDGPVKRMKALTLDTPSSVADTNGSDTGKLVHAITDPIQSAETFQQPPFSADRPSSLLARRQSKKGLTLNIPPIPLLSSKQPGKHLGIVEASPPATPQGKQPQSNYDTSSVMSPVVGKFIQTQTAESTASYVSDQTNVPKLSTVASPTGEYDVRVISRTLTDPLSPTAEAMSLGNKPSLSLDYSIILEWLYLGTEIAVTTACSTAHSITTNNSDTVNDQAYVDLPSPQIITPKKHNNSSQQQQQVQTPKPPSIRLHLKSTADLMYRLNVKYIINVASESPDLDSIYKSVANTNAGSPVQLPLRKYTKLNLYDYEEEDIEPTLRVALKLIDDYHSAHPTDIIYVHCRAGRSRSVSIVIAYLMWKFGWSLTDAYDYVKARRPVASPNIGFMTVLGALEREFRQMRGAVSQTGTYD